MFKTDQEKFQSNLIKQRFKKMRKEKQAAKEKAWQDAKEKRANKKDPWKELDSLVNWLLLAAVIFGLILTGMVWAAVLVFIISVMAMK